MVTKEQVLEVQQKWGDGVVKIGSLKENRAECEAFASKFLDERYAFEAGTCFHSHCLHSPSYENIQVF